MPKKTLDHFIDHIIQQQPNHDFTMLKIYAERTDHKIRKYLHQLIDQNKKGDKYFNDGKLEFAADFKLGMEKLTQSIHLFKKDDPNINGFLNTMDRYMQIIDLNHPRPHLDQEHGFASNDNDASRVSIKESLDELRTRLKPNITAMDSEKTLPAPILELVPKQTENAKSTIQIQRSDDFEL